MTRKFATFAVAFALVAALGIGFVGSAAAQPVFSAHECTFDDGYRGLRSCSAADGN
jgi:hypothetical protein